MVAQPRTLEELAREEDRLLEHVGTLEGTWEAKTAALAALGVFRAYTEIHREYVQLAEAGEVEALKRAIFLQWIETVEPDFLSGILDLDRDAVTRTMELVEQLFTEGAIEDELAWMLPFYYLIAEWAFPAAEECPRFVSYCKTNEPKGLVRPPEGMNLVGRGQMGDYWRSWIQSLTD